jgi:hypothetical protein
VNAHDPDARMRERFAQLRRELAPQAPDAATLIAQQQLARQPVVRLAQRPRLAWAAAATVLLAAALMIARRERLASHDAPRAAGALLAQTLVSDAGTWRGPTDFLLDVPGDELTRGTPVFDGSASIMFTVPAIDRDAPSGAPAGRDERSRR